MDIVVIIWAIGYWLMALIGELQSGPMNNWKFARLLVIAVTLVLIILIAAGVHMPFKEGLR